MGRPANPQQLAALQRIRECIAERGNEAGPRVAKADFLYIPRPTSFRWLRQIRDEDAMMAGQPVPAALAAPGIPAARPAHVMEIVPAGVLDFFAEIAGMTQLCDVLLACSWLCDPAMDAWARETMVGLDGRADALERASETKGAERVRRDVARFRRQHARLEAWRAAADAGVGGHCATCLMN